MKLEHIENDDVLIADANFTCLSQGQHCVVKSDTLGKYVPCADGHHYLDGQEDEHGELVGLAPFLRDGQPLLDPRTTTELMHDRDRR